MALLAAVAAITLLDQSGQPASFRFEEHAVTVVVFLSATCPISNEYTDRLVTLYQEFGKRGVQFLFVNANANESLAQMAAHAKSAEYPFAVYKDSGNVLADRLGATVTPQAFVLTSSGAVAYHGAIDDARNPARVKTRLARDAIQALLEGKTVKIAETKSFGCVIKRVRKSS